MRTEKGNENAKAIRAAWNRENMKTLGTNVKKDVAEKFIEIAHKRGTTQGSMIREYVLATVAEAHDSEASSAGSSPITVDPKVGERLKEFTAYARMNPDKLASMILTQWMDAQVEIYRTLWDVHGPKLDLLKGKKRQ